MSVGSLKQEAFDAEAASVVAEGGRVIIEADNELLCDLDSREAKQRFHSEIDRVAGVLEWFDVAVECWPSKSTGHWHARVTFKGPPLSVIERCVAKAALGSDPVRELLTLGRYRNGIAQPARLFEKAST